jgi:seryl-tRNA synthetase
MELPKNLNDDIAGYCKANNILNIDEFIIKMVKQGFTVEKYGATPHSVVSEKVVEKIITNDEDVKKLTDELETLKNKNAELQQKISVLEKRKDIYGE